MAVFESIIDDIGGLGPFQLLVLFAIESCQFTAGWSMLQMSFARLTPDYECVVENVTSTLANESLNVCDVNGTRCSSFNPLSSSRTVTSEWMLMCDNAWIQKTIISVQMIGVLVGALLSGQLSDAIGRKKVLYSFVLFHVICNFIAAASISWTMFCVMRFFIGIGIGAILVMCLPYPMEFLPMKWRPILSIIPTWALGVSVFAGAAVVLDDWSHLHIACGIFSIPSLFGYFFVPESMRWLTTQGRLDEAHKVLAKMARWNKKELHEDTKQILQQVEKEEREARRIKHVYSFIDIFKTWKQARISIILWIFWFALSVTYYGLSFGVASLHGNIFLNIFLLGVLEVPVQSTTFFTNNWFGRRRSTMFFFFTSSVMFAGCILCLEFTSGVAQGVSINVLSMTVKTLIGSAWSCIQVWGSELYPTVTRNLGYGFSSSGARIGGILAPFIIGLDRQMTFSYVFLSGLLLATTLLCLALPETKGTALRDSLYAKNKESREAFMKNSVKESPIVKIKSVNNDHVHPKA